MKWLYKDADRRYWSIEARKEKQKWYPEPGVKKAYFETTWEVFIKKGDSEPDFEVFTTLLTTQYNEPLKLEDILAAYGSHTFCLLLDMVKHATFQSLEGNPL